MNLDMDKFVAALKAADVEAELDKFATDHKLAVNASQLIAIAKMICSVADVVCPIIKQL